MDGIGHWLGFPPPQYIFRKRKYKDIALNPPDFDPGSWCGAGKALYDPERGEYLLTSRPRSAKNNQRGFAAEIYHSADGISNFECVASLSKAEIMDLTGLHINSIEGTQLLRDPLTGLWHFYLSVDIGEEFVWGGLLWETVLLTAPTLEGSWESRGVVLARGSENAFDAHQARDGTIDIIDGLWYCLYKAKDNENKRRPALATSRDGVSWTKLGALSIDGQDELAFLSGSLFPGGTGILFIGTEMVETLDPRVAHVAADKHAVRHGSSMVHFCAYRIDVSGRNLESILRVPWEASSPVEHPDHPLLGYSTSFYDLKGQRFLLYVEAVDSKHTGKVGLNETVERVLVYETKLA